MMTLNIEFFLKNMLNILLIKYLQTKFEKFDDELYV